MDLDYIERELGLVIPEAYRTFLDHATRTGLNLESMEFFNNAQRMVEFNKRMAKTWPQWDSNFLAIGPDDGCGNWFVIDATSATSDAALLVAHDPVGVERCGSATAFFRSFLQHQDRSSR